MRIRLSDADLHAIKTLFRRHFLPDDHLWIFGSRVDSTKKGGDIDLYIATTAASATEAFKRKLAFLRDLEAALGEQKIDVVLDLIHSPHPLPIHTVATTQGIQLL